MLPNEPKFLITVSIKEFAIPPITDGLIIGKDAAIGVNALQKCLKLLIPEDFDHFETSDDDIVGNILLRSSISRRISRKRIVPFLLQQVKPFMAVGDILHVRLDTEITITQEL